MLPTHIEKEDNEDIFHDIRLKEMKCPWKRGHKVTLPLVICPKENASKWSNSIVHLNLHAPPGVLGDVVKAADSIPYGHPCYAPESACCSTGWISRQLISWDVCWGFILFAEQQALSHAQMAKQHATCSGQWYFDFILRQFHQLGTAVLACSRVGLFQCLEVVLVAQLGYPMGLHGKDGACGGAHQGQCMGGCCKDCDPMVPAAHCTHNLDILLLQQWVNIIGK